MFFFLTLRRPPRSTLFPTRRSSDLPRRLEDLGDAVQQPQHCSAAHRGRWEPAQGPGEDQHQRDRRDRDRKSTRLNSSHVEISYAVFCLKKKKKKRQTTHRRTTAQAP